MALSTKDDILEAISNLTVIELKELLDAFEEKFDVTAAAPVAVAAAAPAGGGGDAAAEEEKDEYDVVLASAGPQKIQVVKVVKDLLGVGLKDAKDLVDAAPNADHGEGHQGRRRCRQGQARRSRRHRRTQVIGRRRRFQSENGPAVHRRAVPRFRTAPSMEPADSCGVRRWDGLRANGWRRERSRDRPKAACPGRLRRQDP